MNAPSHFDFRNANALWCSVLVETLTRLGVNHAVISPGSRSTPLTMALTRHPDITAVPVLDERSAAFFALGIAKREGRPAVLVCTSGTAGANYYPAVIEAQESGVPLLVITADRPPEMRACNSGQTIDQQQLYGAHVNFYHELAVPEVSESMLRYLRQTVTHAVAQTKRPAGPVHLNAPFRDPLPPIDDGGTVTTATEAIDWDRFFVRTSPAPEASLTCDIPQFLTDVHGVIVVGPAQPSDPEPYNSAVAEIASRLGWPVLADGLTPLRFRAEPIPNLITTYDTVLRNKDVADRLKPETVLCLGGWPTSKVLRAWLDSVDAPTLLVSERRDNRDPLHSRTKHLAIGLRAFSEQLPSAYEQNGYTRMWLDYEGQARGKIDARFMSQKELFEGKAAWLLARHLPYETPVFVANSMPVRDLEYFVAPGNRGLQVLCNRGANGIDGTLSTALGMAHDAGRPSVLLTGDLALLHDTNGFLLHFKLRGSLTIVLINNNGGGIFGHLPVAQFDPPFEEFFATPQNVNFAKLAETYGVEHILVRDWPHFRELITALPDTGIRILEIKTDRKADAAHRKQLFAEVTAALV